MRKLKIAKIYDKLDNEIETSWIGAIGDFDCPEDMKDDSIFKFSPVEHPGHPLVFIGKLVDVEENEYGFWIITSTHKYRLDKIEYSECFLCGRLGVLDFDVEGQFYHCSTNVICKISKAKNELIVEICKVLEVDKLPDKLEFLINKIVDMKKEVEL